MLTHVACRNDIFWCKFNTSGETIIMFNENLKTIRKAKGHTQEELAIKIHVVRQTISKWEKGLSVPDADMLSKLADVLEINVSELLGSELKEETLSLIHI